jgi:hypothetical protein
VSGIPHGKDVEYLFGHPFYNDSIGNLTGIVPVQPEWTYLDTNISVFMMDMWVNFTKYAYVFFYYFFYTNINSMRAFRSTEVLYVYYFSQFAGSVFNRKAHLL